MIGIPGRPGSCADVLALRYSKTADFRSKLQNAKSNIADALMRSQQPYIAFSGGKDSLVTAHLVQGFRPSVPLLWSDAELEANETVDYMTMMREVAGDRLIIKFGQTSHAWFTPWVDAPYWREPLPGTVHADRETPEWMASQGYDCVFTGTRAGENRRREGWLLNAGPVYYTRKGVGLTCSPLAWWTEDDVWAAIAHFGLPYNAAYDKMEAAYVPRRRQRVGPLSLTPRSLMAEVWPDQLARLEQRYQRRWID